jgi:hypothetical protein
MLDHPGAVYRKVIPLPWEKWFAWRPVKIHGRRVWLRTVYRRTVICYVDMDKWSKVEYATLFDIIKGEE